jgi:hypothetical protein
VFTSSSWSRRCEADLILAAGNSIRASSHPISDNDRLKNFLMGKSTTDRWSSAPNQSNDHPSIAIEFARGLRVIIRHYRLRSCIFNSSVHPSIVNWILEGRISGHWHSLDEHRYTQILCDGESHGFSIGADRLLEVEAIRLTMTSRNNFGTSQMHLNEFKLSGDLLTKNASLVPNYDTPMNIAKLIAFLVSELLGQKDSKLHSHWTELNSCPDLELMEFASLLSDLFRRVLKTSGRESTESPLDTVKRLCDDHLANPRGSPEDPMWQLASDMIDDLRELSPGSPTFSDIVRDLIHYFGSLRLKSEWSPSTAWTNIEESA